MSGIKTGNKGFVNPLDGKVYTVDPVAKGEDGINVPSNLKSYDPGDMNVDQSIKDLGKQTKTTLGNYLSKATLGQAGASTTANAYPIDPPVESSQESSLRTEKGYPSPLTPASSGNSKKFAADIPSSISNDFFELNSLSQKIKKGLAEIDVPNGDTLLPNVKETDSPIPTYQAAAFSPNYRVPGTSFTNDDILSPPKSFDPSLVKYDNLSKVNPDVEAVIATDLGLKLADVFKTPATLTQGAKNVYPVSVPSSLDLTQLASLTTEGFPSALTVPSRQNEKVFTQNPGSSTSDVYGSATANADGKTQLISKGKTKAAENEELFDGNKLLPNVIKNEQGNVVLPELLDRYNDELLNKNVFEAGIPFIDTKSIDVLSPPASLDPNVNDVNVLGKYYGQPGDGILKSSVKLKRLVQIPKELTTNQYNNFFPVNTPDEENFKFDDLGSISSKDGKFPSPLTPPENQNGPNVFANPLGNSYGKNYTELNVNAIIGLQKGKTVNTSDASPNGNSLLSKIIIQNKQISNFDFLKAYTNSTLSDNEFEPSITFLQENVDLLSPPSTFFATINDIPQSSPKGEYAGIEKTQITLEAFQNKVVNDTKLNEYPVSIPEKEGQLFFDVFPLTSITVKDTKMPAPFSVDSNITSYVPREQIKPDSSDARLANSGFVKGKNVNASYDGHNLLRTVDGNVNTVAGRFLPHKPPGPDVTYEENANLNESSNVAEFGQPLSQPAIPTDHPLNDYKVGPDISKSSVLALGNNRFSPRGVSSAKLNPTLKMIGTDGQLKEVSHMNMARIGIGLTQRAAGEIPAITADKFNPIGNEAEAGALIPGTAQLGFKVDDKLLQARDVLDSLTTNKDDEYDVDGLVSIAPGITFDGMASWGTLNSPSEPFDGGFSSVGLAVLMVLLVVLISAIFTAISYGDSKQAGKAKSSPDGQRVKGKYLFEESPSNAFTSFLPNAFEVFGLRQTNNDFRLCLGAGANAFFLGADNPQADFLTTIQGAAGILVDSLISDESKVGANIVVCRAIIRSSVIFAQYVDSIIRAGSNSGYAAARSTLSIVLKVIRSSKIISAMNVFASLGDVLIDRQNAIRIRDQRYTDANNKIQYSSVLDALDPRSPRTTIQKNRLTFRSTYDSTLAWSAQRAPALYLINKDLDDLSLSKAVGGEFLGPSGLEKKTKGGTDNSENVKTISAVNGRIDDTLRQGFEKRLDSEYVPFYFHDVRTNEIISFHAFLASLSDDYTASYESTEGFGRVEPVKIYKGTTRKISMSFYVAALDEKDFDHMWAKINKLTTMVYPQYTQGRVLTAGTNQFVAPFSQLPGASPLIRIRLGDLLRSNYSKFGLARLFGAGSKRNSLGGMRIPDPNNPDKSVDVIKSPEQATSVMQLRREYIDGGLYDPGATIDAEVLTSYLKTNSIKELNNNPLPSTITFTTDSNGKKVETTSPVKVENPKIFVSNPGSGKVTYDIKVDISRSVLEDGYEGTQTKNIILYNLPRSAVVLTQEHVESKFKIDDRISTKELSSFLNLGNNAIARSFESAGGKGLAGVIESMNFDWYDRVTWETTSSDDLGQAPKMCKVTLTFSPIHDITPGIDHMGYNRAPIYPVGRAMKSSS